MTATPTEQALLERCRRGHPPSQEALYRRYWSFAMSICLRYAPSRDDALELAHDAFLKAFRALDRLDPARPFKPWFRQILVRTAIDRHRSTRRRHALIESSPDLAPPVASEHSVTLEAREILDLLGQLPADHRAVFNLHEVEGYAHEEIADLLGIAASTSRSHLTRARQKLRALYAYRNAPSP